MEALFPDWITETTENLDALFGDAATTLKLTILVKCPEFATGDFAAPGYDNVAHITAVDSLDELLADPAWQDVNNDLYDAQNWHPDAEQALEASVSGTAPTARSVTVEGGAWLYWPLEGPAIATGFIVSIEAGPSHVGDIVMIFRPDNPVYLTGESEDISSRIGFITSLFSYVEAAPGWRMAMGDISIAVPAAQWETARCAHVWIDPQRINYVINPSFRNATIGWRCNGTLGHVATGGGIDRDGVSECAHLTGASPIVLESNLFPTKVSTETWYVTAEVAGTGQARVGIVFFPPSMAEEDAVYVHTPWVTLSGTGANQSQFRRIHAPLPSMETTKEALVRIEFDGTECWVDEVMAAPEDGPGTYFDASWPLGQPSDFSWYGPAGTFADQSYSLFYSNRKNLAALMFGRIEAIPSPEGVPVLYRHTGEAHKWVPEGVNIVPHWDDVFSARVHTWMDDVVVPPKDYTDRSEVSNVTTSGAKWGTAKWGTAKWE